MSGSRRSVPSPTAVVAGEGHLWRPSMAYLALALLLATAALAYLLFLWLTPASTDAGLNSKLPAPSVAATAASQQAGNWPPPPVAQAPAALTAAAPQLPEGDADPTRDLSSYVMRGENPTMPEVITRLRQAGERGGLAAFSPPGTRPPLIGLAVPEDFVLPEGYVRHHQATDDGQRIEAILMFAPDRQFFDAAKRPITVPANRVVPPEYAPPGMPIRRIVLPKPIEPGSR